MADPYTVLGVGKNADEKAIKSAFRKLAKKYHPDTNADNPDAQKKFSKINQAYEIVGDKDKRARFDRGEIDDTGKDRFAGFQGSGAGGAGPFGGFSQGGGFHQSGFDQAGGFEAQGFAGAEDILKDLFGSAFGGNAAAMGGAAAGTGGTQFRRTYNKSGGGGSGFQQEAPSLNVETKVKVTLSDLMRGKATALMPDGKQVSVSIPAGAHSGQKVRLRGQGRTMPGRTPGDVIVELVIVEDRLYRRYGCDLERAVEIPLETAVVGGKLAVETPEGKLSLNVPAGTSSGKRFRLKGRGLPQKSGGSGDLYLVAALILPEDRLEDLQAVFTNS